MIDEIVRDDARQMLAAAFRAEVAAYVHHFVDEVDEYGRRLVVRNGHHNAREVTTAAGAVPVRAPRVNDKRIDEETREAAPMRVCRRPRSPGSPASGKTRRPRSTSHKVGAGGPAGRLALVPR